MLPDFVIIGAMKCGTVSLHHYLSLHPQIFMPPIDELHFFVEENNWNRGLGWYESHFPETNQVNGERSTSYTKYPVFSGVAERMYQVIPEAKLIYSVRDPIDRIVSQYIHSYAKRYENRGFDKSVLDNYPDNQYIYLSKYYMQIEQYLQYYPRSNLLVLSLRELNSNPERTLESVFKFLNIDISFRDSTFKNVFHQSTMMTRPTWIDKQLGQIRGKRHLKRVLPWAFRRKIRRPLVSQAIQDKLWEAIIDDFNNFIGFVGRDLIFEVPQN